MVSTDISFLNYNRYDAVAKEETDAGEIIDLKDVDWQDFVSVVDVGLAGKDDVDDDTEEHHHNHHPGHDMANLHVRNIFVAG